MLLLGLRGNYFLLLPLRLRWIHFFFPEERTKQRQSKGDRLVRSRKALGGGRLPERGERPRRSRQKILQNITMCL